VDSQEIVVFVTVGSLQDGKAISRVLVEKKLVACVNLIPQVFSIFSWEGSVSEEKECLMILKTRKELYARLEVAVRELHKYDVPEIIAFPVTHGFPEYLAWVRSSTQSGG